MAIFYRIALWIYITLMKCVSPFYDKARRMIQGRRQWEQELKSQSEKLQGAIWFHCSSSGEFEQGRPLIEKWKKQFPHKPVLLSFFSPSGYEMRKKYQLADYVCYLPFDTPRNAKKFFDAVHPEMLILIKYEFWYHFICEAKHRQVKLFLVSGIFRPKHWMIRYSNAITNSVFQAFDWMFVQDDTSCNLLKMRGVIRCSTAGDTRYQRVIDIAAEQWSNRTIEKFIAGRKCLVAGSTWPADEKLLCRLLEKTNEELALIIVPHEIGERHLSSLKKKFSKAAFYTQICSNEQVHANVLIIDTLGMLSKIYRYAWLAYIGGGFGKGIHNCLEAAVYGIPVIFGPKYRKFIEANALIHSGGAFSVCNSESLQHRVSLFLQYPDQVSKAGNAAQKHVASNSDSASHIFDEIMKI